MSQAGIVELIEDLSFENPPPEERWFNRRDFDPMHRMADLRSAAQKGHIELETEGDRCRFRLTTKARRTFAATLGEKQRKGQAE